MAGENETTETSTEGSQTPPANAPHKTGFVGSATGGSLAAGSTPAASDAASGQQPPAVGHGGAQMSPEAISERVARAERSVLKKIFDEDIDVETAKALVAKAKGKTLLSDEEKKEFDRLRRLEEIRKRSRQTEAQRIEAAMKEKDEENKRLKAQLKERETGEVLRKQDEIVVTTATSYVDPKFVKYAKRDFAEFVNTLAKEDPAKFAKFDQKATDKWFAEYAKTNPQFAKPAAPPAGASEGSAGASGQGGAKPPSQPTKRVVTTTKTGARPPAAPVNSGAGSLTGKTPKPGLPNSMNKSELRQYMQSKGMRTY
jgi:hypothetical protein